MHTHSQFQNLVLQQSLQEAQEYTQQQTIIRPALTLPVKRRALVALPPALLPFPQWAPARKISSFSEQEAGDLAVSITQRITATSTLQTPEEAFSGPLPVPRKKKMLRGVALLVSVLLLLALYLTWQSATPTSASPTVVQQTASDISGLQATSTDSTATSDGGTMVQVYILGAVEHPGVYTLPADARVYQLVQAAGGTLPNADLVELNLAAKLTDGEEIYVLSVGEIPPTSLASPPGADSSGTPAAAPGQLVNINTATETEMEQILHVSSTTATEIITYRTQHGPYTSVSQLLQVISQSIYDRIKDMVTV